MTEKSVQFPVCGERPATQGLSFFMINVAVDQHSKASPQRKLRIEFFPGEKRVEIKKAEDSA